MNRLVGAVALLMMMMVMMMGPALLIEQKVHAENGSAVTETIETTEAFPTVGQRTTIVTSTTNAVVNITYSPTSALFSRESVKFAPQTQRVSWIPQRPGIVELALATVGPSTSTQTTQTTQTTTKKNISVRFDGVPRSGVAVMIIAGLFLFGGAFFSLRSLLAQD